jgi:peptidoglycan/LPS O-acetylase OafA/YrhL
VLVLGPIYNTLSTQAYFTNSATWNYLQYLLIVKLPGVLPGVFDNHEAPTINGSLWTLQYEVWCYVGVAILMATHLLAKRWVPISLAIVWLAAYAHYQLVGYSAKLKYAFIGTNTETDQLLLFAGYFIAGMVVYDRVMAGFRFKAWMGWLALAIFFAVSWLTTPASQQQYTGLWALCYPGIPYSYMLFPFIIFTLAFAPAPEKLRHPLGRGRDWSYGIYIYGMPTQHIIYSLGGGTWPFVLYQIVCLLSVLPLAAASWHWIEGPALRLKGGKKSAL